MRAKKISIIIIEGWDEITKSNVVIKIDFSEKVYDCIISSFNDAQAKSLEKLDKYFL